MIILIALSLAVAISQPVPGVTVSVKILKDVSPYELPESPVPKWNKDGSLSFITAGSATGSSRIVEKGYVTSVEGTALTLCYLRVAVHYEPDQPIPAVLYSVPLEFHIKGLKQGKYTIKDVSVCPK